MVQITKNNQEAIDCLSSFINGQWLENNNGGFEYRNIGYDHINKATYRNFCLEEQNNVCCYCSKEIDNSPTTELEHIIPKAVIDNPALQRYFEYSSILAQNIVLQNNFTAASSLQVMPPFPHHIAYHNIVASCNGRIIDTSEDFTCCNRNRSNDFIPPFNLMPKSIDYMNDGTVYYVNDEIDNRHIKPLNLNKDLLKSIRRIWLLFAKSDVTEAELVDVANEAKIKEIIALHLDANPLKSSTDGKIIDSFKTLQLWETLMKYKYFLHYFRTNNN